MRRPAPQPETGLDPRPAPRGWARVRSALLTPVGRRVPVGKNGAPHGVAIIIVLVAVAFMSAIVTDLGANERVRYRLALHERDAMKAEFMAESGLNMARMTLVVETALQPLISQLASFGIPLPASAVWQLVPIDSDIFKGLASGSLQNTFGVDTSEGLQARSDALAERQAAYRDQLEPGQNIKPFEIPEGGFGAFDGSFTVAIDDENRKISLRGWHSSVNQADRYARATALFNMFKDERFDFLFEEPDFAGQRTTRPELVAALYDYADSNEEAVDGTADLNNWGRQAAGSETSGYTAYGDIEPKNAYYDSQDEIRLVRGWTDAHQRAFGDSISVYAEGKINVLTADTVALVGLMHSCSQVPNDPILFDQERVREMLTLWQQVKSGGGMLLGIPMTPDGFLAILQQQGMQVNDTCKDLMDVNSTIFKVKAQGKVGDVVRTLTAVLRTVNGREEFYYFAID